MYCTVVLIEECRIDRLNAKVNDYIEKRWAWVPFFQCGSQASIDIRPGYPAITMVIVTLDDSTSESITVIE